MQKTLGRTGILIILVGIISTVSISQYGQVGDPGETNWSATPGCEFITGDCCPGDVISVANCDDGDLCTADYCTVSVTVGSCVHIPLPDPNCNGGPGPGPGPDPGPGPGPDPESSLASISSQDSSEQVSSEQVSSAQGSSEPRSSTQSSSEPNNTDACDACTQQLCDKCQSTNEGCYVREIDERTLTECFAGPRSGWNFCCGSNGGGDDGGETGGGQSECGNGKKEGNEKCDDGNTKKWDGCRNDCTEEKCGDGILDGGWSEGVAILHWIGEECDDGNALGGDGCSAECKREYCGNGLVEPIIVVPGRVTIEEECDWRVDSYRGIPCPEGVQDCLIRYEPDPEGYCTGECKVKRCGNEITEQYYDKSKKRQDEECDKGDNNSDEPDAECRTNCTLPKCGDGIADVNHGEQCGEPSLSCLDTGINNLQSICDNDLCACVARGCGDGTIVPPEECDRGIDENCTPECKRPVCGDGFITPYANEECDNGTTCANGDRCYSDQNCRDGSTCAVRCNGSCTSSCTKPECLNSILECGEECEPKEKHGACEQNKSILCDPNNNERYTETNRDCLEKGQCVNGFCNNTNKPCTDQDTLNCEVAHSCEWISDDPSCNAECNNTSNKTCAIDNDCSGNDNCCVVIDGEKSCAPCDTGGGSSSSANPECGNGVREGSEICDEGINNSDDTEAACRKDCTPGTCGNGQIETDHGEECDCGSIDTPNCITVNADGIGVLCRLSCTGDYCGDGNIYSKGMDDRHRTMDDEVCDLGDQNSDVPNATCRTDCKPMRCGDGIIDSGEECDSGEMRCTDGSLCAVLDPDVTRWKDTCIWNPAFPSNQGSCKASETNECDSACKEKNQSQSSSSSSSSSDEGNLSRSSTDSSESSISGPSHAECNGNKCELVPGAGRNQCVLSLGCGVESHLECNNNACQQITGPGAHQCHPQLDCGKHAACINYACKILPGPGSISCVSDTDCLHIDAICQNGIIEGDEECEAAIECVSALRICDIQTCTCPLKPKTSSSSSSAPMIQLSSSARSTIFAQTSSEDFLALIEGIQSNNTEYEEDVIEATLVAAASVCGNGTLEISEECDDSNRRDNDGCNSTCLLEIGICGDGIVQSLLGEQCENATHDSSLPYQCSKCHFLSLSCGDGTKDPGEECDDGNQNSTSPDAHCRPNCSVSRCGDSVLDSTEICDDGNRLSGDGCDRFCREEGADGSEVTEVAADISSELALPQLTTTSYQLPTQYGFPQYPNFGQLPYQLPLAQLQPLIATQGPVGDTGPAAIAVIGAGAAAGLSWMRRKKRK